MKRDKDHCFQRYNIYGHVMTKFMEHMCGREDHTTTYCAGIHHTECGSYEVARKDCSLHVPLYDSFNGWIFEVLDGKMRSNT